MEIDERIIEDFEKKVVAHPEVWFLIKKSMEQGFLNGDEEFASTLKSVLKWLFDLGLY